MLLFNTDVVAAVLVQSYFPTLMDALAEVCSLEFSCLILMSGFLLSRTCQPMPMTID